MKIVLKENDFIDFKMDKGAILVGPNSTGKSTILNRISKNKKVKIEINEETEEYTVKKITSETSQKDNFDGLKSTNSIILKNKIKLIEKENLAKEKLNPLLEKEHEEIKNFLKKENKINIYGSGIDIEYSYEINFNLDLKLKIKLNDRWYEIDEASTGVKILICFLINEINDTKNTDKIIYLFDEIDAFLHPQWIDLICKLIFEITEQENSKFILITHNPLFLSKLIKKYFKLISFIEMGENPNNAKILSLNWEEIITNVKNELNNKPKYFESTEENFSDLYIVNYITSFLLSNICRIFFDDNLVFVEGMVEEIYFNNLYKNYNIIQTGGFHQFPLMKYILDELMRNTKYYKKIKFIIDNDKNEYCDYVFDLINNDEKYNIYKMEENFDIFLGKNKKISSYEKIPNVLSVISNTKNNIDEIEKEKLIEFLDK